MNYRIISIGALSVHELWKTQGQARTPHATTTLVSSEGRNILIDPGLPPQVIAARLSERSGLSPEDITDVFLTCFRPAHRWGITAFPNANWLIAENEREQVGVSLFEMLKKAEDDQTRELIQQDIAVMKKCKPAEDKIAQHVDLFPLPGFTPGGCGLLLSHPNSTTLIAGDAIATSEHLEQGRVLRGAFDVNPGAGELYGGGADRRRHRARARQRVVEPNQEAVLSVCAPPSDNPVSLLQQMVRINSVNGALAGKARAETSLCDFLIETAESWGLHTRRLPVDGRCDQLLVTYQADPGNSWLLFDSHMDTVSVDGMTIDPFGGELRGGRIYGRGACDTKGTGAAMLWALKRYKDAGGGPNNVALYFGVDEEVAMHGVRSFVDRDLGSLGFKPAGVIVGEPTELLPIIAHNGLIRWKITTHGVAAHSSVPHQGRSAISAMLPVLEAVESKYIPTVTAEHDLTGYAACSVNMIRGGTAANIIPDRCVIDIDRRVTPNEDFDSIGDALAQTLQGVRKSKPELEYKIDTVVTHPPLLPDDSEAFIGWVKGVLSEQGLRTLTPGAPYATHAGYYCRSGLATVVIGPGEMHKAHTSDEYISVDQLTQGTELYLAMMRHDGLGDS